MLGVLIMENAVADRYWCVGQMLYPIYSPKCMYCAYVCYLVLASCILEIGNWVMFRIVCCKNFFLLLLIQIV